MYDVVFNLKTGVEKGQNLEAAYLHEIIYNWLVKHILVEDKKYESFLAQVQSQQKPIS
jgi:hemerythrin